MLGGLTETLVSSEHPAFVSSTDPLTVLPESCCSGTTRAAGRGGSKGITSYLFTISVNNADDKLPE